MMVNLAVEAPDAVALAAGDCLRLLGLLASTQQHHDMAANIAVFIDE